MKSSRVLGFNYGSLSEDDRTQAKSAADEIRSLDNDMKRNAIEIGRRLTAVKEIMHNIDQYHAWVDHELRWKRSRAAKFIRVANHFGDFPQVDNFCFSAMLSLCSGGKPQEARAEALALAAAGEWIGCAKASQLIAKHLSSKRAETTVSKESRKLRVYLKSMANRWPISRRQEFLRLLSTVASERAMEAPPRPSPADRSLCETEELAAVSYARFE